jgi:hypothetical protein
MSFCSPWGGSGLAICERKFLKVVNTPAKIGLNNLQTHVVERVFNHHDRSPWECPSPNTETFSHPTTHSHSTRVSRNI